jgi:hypothetical protein
MLVVQGWLAPDFHSVVEGKKLPEAIQGPAGTLRRVSEPIDLRD